MDVPGWQPRDLLEDFVARRKYCEIASDMVVHLDEMIEDNHKVIEDNAKKVKRSMLALISSPIVGALAAGFAALYPFVT